MQSLLDGEAVLLTDEPSDSKRIGTNRNRTRTKTRSPMMPSLIDLGDLSHATFALVKPLSAARQAI